MPLVIERFPSAGHDHRRCVSATLAAAERTCADNGVRLTARRRRILEIVAEGHRAIGAYDIVAALARDGRPPAPISVYRVLDFLVEQGLVHRLASCNAYIACSRPDGGHRAQFLICDRCRAIAEMDDPGVTRALAAGADAAGFVISGCVVEIAGVCETCREPRPADA